MGNMVGIAYGNPEQSTLVSYFEGSPQGASSRKISASVVPWGRTEVTGPAFPRPLLMRGFRQGASATTGANKSRSRFKTLVPAWRGGSAYQCRYRLAHENSSSRQTRSR